MGVRWEVLELSSKFVLRVLVTLLSSNCEVAIQATHRAHTRGGGAGGSLKRPGQL